MSKRTRAKTGREDEREEESDEKDLNVSKL